jgi:hypothetical protein
LPDTTRIVNPLCRLFLCALLPCGPLEPLRPTGRSPPLYGGPPSSGEKSPILSALRCLTPRALTTGKTVDAAPRPVTLLSAICCCTGYRAPALGCPIMAAAHCMLAPVALCHACAVATPLNTMMLEASRSRQSAQERIS